MGDKGFFEEMFLASDELVTTSGNKKREIFSVQVDVEYSVSAGGGVGGVGVVESRKNDSLSLGGDDVDLLCCSLCLASLDEYEYASMNEVGRGLDFLNSFPISASTLVKREDFGAT